MRDANMAASCCSHRSSVASFGLLLMLMVLGTRDAREGEVVDEVLVRNVKTGRDRALNNFFSSSLSGVATGGA